MDGIDYQVKQWDEQLRKIEEKYGTPVRVFMVISFMVVLVTYSYLGFALDAHILETEAEMGAETVINTRGYYNGLVFFIVTLMFAGVWMETLFIIALIKRKPLRRFRKIWEPGLWRQYAYSHIIFSLGVIVISMLLGANRYRFLFLAIGIYVYGLIRGLKEENQ